MWLVSVCWAFGKIEFARQLVGYLALRAPVPLVVLSVAPLEVAPAPLEMVAPPLEMSAGLLELVAVLLETGVNPTFTL